jgi:transglutaminase-like putative cysteine protease
MRIFVKRIYAKEGGLLRIDQQVDDPGGAKKFEARIAGDTMTLITTVAGVTKEKTLPKPKESLRDALKQAELVGKNAKVGDELGFCIFEPMYEKEIDGVSRIESVEERVFEGAPTKVFRIRSVLPSMGIDSVMYAAENGTILEDQIAGVITMRLEPKEIAQDVNYSNDVIVSNAAPADKPVEDPRERASIRLRIFGPINPNHVFSDERQQMLLKDGLVEFSGKRISLEGFTAARLPIDKEAVKPWLKPALFVQSDDPKLVQKARDLVGDEQDTFAISTKLCHWVYENVRTTFSARLTNALEVLEKPEGDCTEHSILFIGLARAAGLPAREVAGLIYMADTKPAFYFHQWAMVWVGKWIDVDPTFNQPLADVTHIKLAEGDLFEQARLIPTIGRLRIEVEDQPRKETP